LKEEREGNSALNCKEVWLTGGNVVKARAVRLQIRNIKRTPERRPRGDGGGGGGKKGSFTKLQGTKQQDPSRRGGGSL